MALDQSTKVDGSSPKIAWSGDVDATAMQFASPLPSSVLLRRAPMPGCAASSLARDRDTPDVTPCWPQKDERRRTDRSQPPRHASAVRSMPRLALAYVISSALQAEARLTHQASVRCSRLEAQAQKLRASVFSKQDGAGI